MISDIYTYIQGIVSELDSSLLLIDDPYGELDISNSNEVENGYKIIIGATDTKRDSSFVQRTIPVSVEVTLKAYRDLIEDFQTLYDFALSVEGELISLIRINNESFSAVFSQGVSPLPYDSNGRVIKFKIAVNFIRYFDCD